MRKQKNYKPLLLTILFIVIAISIIIKSGIANNIIASVQYNQAVGAFKAKNYDKAIEGFNTWLKYNPKSKKAYKAHCLLGISYSSKGDTINAEKILEKAVKDCPTQWNAYTFLADIKRAQHNYPAAVEYYTKAMNMPTIPKDAADYYKTLIKEVNKEQLAYNAKGIKINLIKNSVNMNLEKTWQKAYETGNDSNWLIEYELKGEDVNNYKWSKLVTVQYYEKKFYPGSVAEYFSEKIATLKNTAKDSKKAFKYHIISKTPKEIIYEWAYENGQESEIARIIQTPRGLYNIYFAKQGTITSKERTKWLNILKSAQIHE